MSDVMADKKLTSDSTTEDDTLDDTLDDSSVVTTLASRVALAEEELRKAQADREHWRSLANQKREISARENSRQEPEGSDHFITDDSLVTTREQLASDRDEALATRERMRCELIRLKEHLLTIEEEYTQQLLVAADRERDQQRRLDDTERQVTSLRALADQSQHRERTLQTERDMARNQLSVLEDKVEKCSSSVANLQLVIQQIQRENERHLLAEKRKHEEELMAERSVAAEVRRQLRERESRMADTEEALSAAGRLAETLDRKEMTVRDLRRNAEDTKSLVEDLRRQIATLNTDAEGKVDKAVVKSLIIGYFVAPADKRPEVQRLLARVLDFNAEEMSSSGVQGFGKKKQISESLSQKFVLFLQNESKPTVPLEAQDITRDLSRGLIQSSQKLNPFLVSTLGSRHSSANSSTDNLNQLLSVPLMSSPVVISKPETQ